MTTLQPPSFLQQVATETAAEARLMLQGLLATGGVVGPSDLLVAQHSTPNMSVDVAAGGCWIKGTESSTQGTYHCYNDALVNLVIAASDATNPRRDLVIAKVQDQIYSGGVNAWSLAVVTGTPAGSPADPAVPANSITLARVAVAALAGSILQASITDLRTFATTYNRNNYYEGGGLVVGPINATEVVVASLTVPAQGFMWRGLIRTYTTLVGTVASDAIQLRLRQDNLTGAVIRSGIFGLPVFATTEGFLIGKWDQIPDGAKTFVVTAARFNGSGTITTAADQGNVITVDVRPL